MARRVERRAALERPTELAGAGPEAGAGNVALRAGPLALHLHPVVFPLALVAALAAAAWLGRNPQPPALPAPLALAVLAAPALFAALGVAVALSPWGRVRLGGVAARPEYGTAAWLAMLALPGLGLQLVVQGTAEPVAHLAAALAPGDGALAPLGGAAGNPDEARRLALAASLHHWGPLPWSMPATLALALALGSYNRGLPLCPRSALHPLLGARTWGWAGHLVDAAAAALTVLAVAVALALGAAQLAAAAGYLTGQLSGAAAEGRLGLLLALLLTGLAAAVAWRGLARAIEPLAVGTAGLAGVLLAFMLLMAPGLSVLGGAVDALGAYGVRLAALALPVGRQDTGFGLGWTLPRWAWWLAWTPALGVYLARISRGRTVRAFLAAALVVPGLAAALWLGAFGSTAIRQIVDEGVAAIAEAPPELRAFLLLQELPVSALTGLATLALMVLLHACAAAPAALSVDTMTTAGRVGAPPVQRLFWALLAAVAAALLAAGPPGAWKAAALWAAPVLVLALLLAWWSILRTLLSEPRA